MLDAVDLILFDSIKKNIDHFEDIIDKILDTPYKLNFTQENYLGQPDIKVEYKDGKEYNHTMLLLGSYEQKKSEWVWFPGMNKLFNIPDLQEEIKDYYNNADTINEILKDKIKIDYSDHIIIPYFCAIHMNRNPKFNLMRVAVKNKLLYILIDLNLKPVFDMKKYYKSLNSLRVFLKVLKEKKMSRTPEKKSSKKSASKKIRNLSRFIVKL